MLPASTAPWQWFSRTTVNQLSLGTGPSSTPTQPQDDNHLALAQTRLDSLL
ncbi:hypothetical protein [Leptothermofonsia sp. ETS-13]|uniref:hypothetical protein n=1 Tax=Leptothermofonsia sp. ETS-13 TaxID=3035696 RepID=UPI003BA331BD